MKLAFSFVVHGPNHGVVEFPIDVRRLFGSEAPFFPLGLAATCLYEHVSTGGQFTRTGQPTHWAVRTPQSRPGVFRAFVLEGPLVIAEADFHVECHSTPAGAR